MQHSRVSDAELAATMVTALQTWRVVFPIHAWHPDERTQPSRISHDYGAASGSDAADRTTSSYTAGSGDFLLDLLSLACDHFRDEPSLGLMLCGIRLFDPTVTIDHVNLCASALLHAFLVSRGVLMAIPIARGRGREDCLRRAHRSLRRDTIRVQALSVNPFAGNRCRFHYCRDRVEVRESGGNSAGIHRHGIGRRH